MKLLDRFTPEQLHAAIDQANTEHDYDTLAALDALLDDELRDWTTLARPKQLPPDGDWLIWLLVTGRRWGKTRTAAEWLRTRALATVGNYAICAPTYADVRDVCVEQRDGDKPSGFLSVCRPGEVANYNRSLGELTLANGSRVKMLSADEPDRARGWGFVAAWCDEFSSWKRPATWYETLLPAVSMSDRHRFVITTTPKRNELTRMIVKRAEKEPETVRLVRGHTGENAENLGAGVVDELRTSMSLRLARQELEGELLDDVEGALWTAAVIRHVDKTAEIDLGVDARICVGVDPAVTSGEESDETGIVVCARGDDGRYWVVNDLSGKHTPTDAMRIAAQAFHHHEADEVVIERNNGGDYLPALMRTIDPSVRVRTVTASHGKQTRAQPVVGLYEAGMVTHLGEFPELEEQMCSWVLGDPSPDRVDALVWAITALPPGRRLRFRGVA